MAFRAARVVLATFFRVLFIAFPVCALAENATVPVHGLWIWGTLYLLDDAGSREKLRDFCRSQDISEVYLSISGRAGPGTTFSGPLEESEIASLVALLHGSRIRVEALLGSIEADQPGMHRNLLLEQVRGIVQFNRKHPKDRFDGIHLDIEPQQRPENYGPENRKFLLDLVETFRAVGRLAEANQMSVNADIPTKLLKGDVSERRRLLSSLPRLTLMLYQLSSPDDGDNSERKTEKLDRASQEFLAMAYAGLSDTHLARMGIALRTADYGDLLAEMLKTLDQVNRPNPHYLGWARHSYNDSLRKVP
jgi:hypothetical protein